MTETLSCRFVSSLAKGLVTDSLDAHPTLTAVSVLREETLDLQLFIDSPAGPTRHLTFAVGGMDAVLVREVVQVPVDLPCYPQDTSVGTARYLPSPSGLYPDLLQPTDRDRLYLRGGVLTALWLSVTPTEAGVYPLTVTLLEKGEPIAAATVTVTVVNAVLPKLSLLYAHWFHYDCLADYYHVPIFSERHWEIIGNFLRVAVKNGVNCLYTPIVTPALDTDIGGERPTVQLVGITKTGEEYAFDFSLLKRFLDLARDCGVTHFEIAHLFTQWGAKAAPKVMATVDGVETRLFGWDTPAAEGEYPRFLAALLPALKDFLRKEGVLDRCRFHISDEPKTEQLEDYRKAQAVAAPFLADGIVIDALSSVEFFREGLVPTPVPGSNHIEPFLTESIGERWTYTCCVQWDRVGNRFLAYPSFRNRILGVQLYKFGIQGFLQWGYNYYYSMHSRRLINPFLTQSADGQVPCGDAFDVYPAPDGTPLESIRIAVFREAIADREALLLCEKIIGRDALVALIDRLAGMPLTFADYPDNDAFLLSLREEVNRILSLH